MKKILLFLLFLSTTFFNTAHAQECNHQFDIGYQEPLDYCTENTFGRPWLTVAINKEDSFVITKFQFAWRVENTNIPSHIELTDFGLAQTKIDADLISTLSCDATYSIAFYEANIPLGTFPTYFVGGRFQYFVRFDGTASGLPFARSGQTGPVACPISVYGCIFGQCPILDVNLCSSEQNYAFGYDESALISINNVENAEGELSIVWNNGETTAGINVSPDQTTTYNVTVTDENGCTGTAQHQVIVYNVAYNKPEKDAKEKDEKKLAKEAVKVAKDLEKGHNEVIMTHKGDHEHKVKAKDVAKKLNDKKGDWTLGTLAMLDVDFSGGHCADEDRFKTDLQEHDGFEIEDELSLYAHPNPVRSTLMLNSETKLTGTIYVYDLFGKLMDEQIAIDEWEISLDFTSLRKGLYIILYQNSDGMSRTIRVLKE